MIKKITAFLVCLGLLGLAMMLAGTKPYPQTYTIGFVLCGFSLLSLTVGMCWITYLDYLALKEREKTWRD